MSESFVLTPSGNLIVDPQSESKIILERGSAILTDGFSLPTASGKLKALVMNEHLSRALFEEDKRPTQCIVVRIKNGVPYTTSALAKPSGNYGFILEEPSSDMEADFKQSTLNFLPTAKETLALLHQELNCKQKISFNEFGNFVKNTVFSGGVPDDFYSNEVLNCKIIENEKENLIASPEQGIDIEEFLHGNVEGDSALLDRVHKQVEDQMEVERSLTDAYLSDDSAECSSLSFSHDNLSCEITGSEKSLLSLTIIQPTNGGIAENPSSNKDLNNKPAEIETESLHAFPIIEPASDENNAVNGSVSQEFNQFMCPSETVQDIIDRLTKELSLENNNSSKYLSRDDSVERLPLKITSLKKVIKRHKKKVVKKSARCQKSAKRAESRLFDSIQTLGSITSRNSDMSSMRIHKLSSYNQKSCTKRTKNKRNFSHISELQKGKIPRRRSRRIQHTKKSNSSLGFTQNSAKEMLNAPPIRRKHVTGKTSFSDPNIKKQKRTNYKLRQTRLKGKKNKGNDCVTSKQSFDLITKPHKLILGLNDWRVCSTEAIAIELKQEVFDDSLEPSSSVSIEKIPFPSTAEFGCEAVTNKVKEEEKEFQGDIFHGPAISNESKYHSVLLEVKTEEFVVEELKQEPGTDVEIEEKEERRTLLNMKNSPTAEPQYLDSEGELQSYIKEEEDYYFLGDSPRQGIEALSWGYNKVEFTEKQEEGTANYFNVKYEQKINNSSSNYSEKYICYHCGYKTRRKKILKQHISLFHIKIKHCSSAELYKVKYSSKHYPNWKRKRRNKSI